jgi:hypothetical protein
MWLRTILPLKHEHDKDYPPLQNTPSMRLKRQANMGSDVPATDLTNKGTTASRVGIGETDPGTGYDAMSLEATG